VHSQPAYIETHARRSDSNITETQSFSRQNHTSENIDGREIDNDALDPDLQEILTRKPMPAQYIDLPARQPIRSNTDNELSTSSGDNCQTNNNELSQLISTMQAMANQIRSMRQVMQETQMTNSAMATLLHNDIADRKLARDLPPLNVSIKKLPAQVRRRVTTTANKMTWRQAILASTSGMNNANPSNADLQTLPSSSSGQYACSDPIFDDGDMDMQEWLHSGADPFLIAVAQLAFTGKHTESTRFLINL
jgi:hypothetical protein